MAAPLACEVLALHVEAQRVQVRNIGFQVPTPKVDAIIAPEPRADLDVLLTPLFPRPPIRPLVLGPLAILVMP